MGVRVVRKPSANYIVRSGANYYAEDDVNLENSLGTTDQDYYASLVNILWGKIHIDNTPYLVSIDDMEIQGEIENYNTISNVDDIVGLRYAYGNQNGYAIGIGSELSANYENGTFTVNSGRAVIQGDEIDIDANGLSTTLDTTSGTRYFKIYLKTNLDSNVAELESYYSSTSYDTISEPSSGDVISGNTAYLLLYTLELNGTTEVEKSKIVKPIYYNSKRLVWSGNVNIGNSNLVLTPIATVPAKQNVLYEVHGNTSVGGTVQTFVIMLPIEEYNENGYSAQSIVDIDFDVLNPTLMLLTKVQIKKTEDRIVGLAYRKDVYMNNGNFSYYAVQAKITKIYEIE